MVLRTDTVPISAGISVLEPVDLSAGRQAIGPSQFPENLGAIYTSDESALQTLRMYYQQNS